MSLTWRSLVFRILSSTIMKCRVLLFCHRLVFSVFDVYSLITAISLSFIQESVTHYLHLIMGVSREKSPTLTWFNLDPFVSPSSHEKDHFSFCWWHSVLQTDNTTRKWITHLLREPKSEESSYNWISLRVILFWRSLSYFFFNRFHCFRERMSLWLSHVF